MAYAQFKFDQWSQMDGDPLDPDSPAGRVVRALRTWKGLDPAVPPISKFKPL
jgi:hypothetical protein